MKFVWRIMRALVISIPCLVTLVFLLKALLHQLSLWWSLPLINSLSSGDLLNGIGSFAAVIIAVVSYQCDMEHRHNEELLRRKKAKPEIEVGCEQQDFGFTVSIANVGPQPIKSVIVEEKPVASIIEPGKTVSFHFISFDGCEDYDVDFYGENYVVSTSSLFESPNIWILLYDVLGNAWLSEYALEEDYARPLDGPSWVA